MQLQQFGFNLKTGYGDNIDKEGIAFIFDSNKEDILQKFRAMWTEMGDYLSRQYAGTDSTISRVSRDGKEGFVGGLDHKFKVAYRYRLNVMVDNPLHTTIDVLLGKHLMTGSTSEQQVYIQQFLRELQDSYSVIDSVKVVQGSWNLKSDYLKREDVDRWI